MAHKLSRSHCLHLERLVACMQPLRQSKWRYIDTHEQRHVLSLTIEAPYGMHPTETERAAMFKHPRTEPHGPITGVAFESPVSG